MENKHDQLSKTFWFLLAGSACTFSYIFMVSFLRIPKENERLVDTILGVLLGTILTGSFNYFTGTTLGSQKKDATLAAAQDNISNALASTPPPQNTTNNKAPNEPLVTD